MSWAIVASASSVPWAKWIDRDAALAHLRVVRWIVEAADNARLMEARGPVAALLDDFGQGLSPAQFEAFEADRYARQVERCRMLAESIRGFCLACDVLPLALGAYAPARLAGDAGIGDIPALFTAQNEGAWRRAAFGLLSVQNASVRDAIASGRDVALDLALRIDFDASGAVLVLSEPADPSSGVDRRETKSVVGGPWSSWDGWVTKTWSPPWGAASSRVEVSALAPISYSWELLRSVGRALVVGGIQGACDRTWIWLAARNARLSRLLGGTGLPSTIVEASAQVDIDALGRGELPPIVGQLAALTIGIVSAINPIAGLVLGLVVGIVGVLQRLVPGARAYATDVWGRRQPFLEKFDLSGTIADRAAPTIAIPAPLMAIAPDPVPVLLVSNITGNAPAPGIDPPKGAGVGGLVLGAIVLRLILGGG